MTVLLPLLLRSFRVVETVIILGAIERTEVYGERIL